MRARPVLEARRLSFAYRREKVVDEVSLALYAGEMVGIVGPNGSGKSTLLRLLTGVLTPNQGEIAVEGRPLSSYSRRQLSRLIAVVPQDTIIGFPFSVMEVVLMGRSPHLGTLAFEGERDVEVAHRAMLRTGVWELADRSVHEISGGERQRVVVARALAQEASILLLDEPTAFLDIKHEVETYDLLREVQEEGRSVLTVLHDLNLAALYCDRVILLDHGRVVCDGPPREVLTYAVLTRVYQTEIYVAPNDITGAMNILPLSRGYRQRLRGGGSSE